MLDYFADLFNLYPLFATGYDIHCFDISLTLNDCSLMYFMPTSVLYAGKKGSKYSKPRATSPAKIAVQLTTIMREVLVGLMLGDGHMERAKPTHNSRMQLEQTFPMHAAYFNWLYIIFLPLMGKGPRVNIRKADTRTGNIYSQMQVKTLAFPCLNEFHDLFYPGGKKVVPQNIGQLLTPRALAVWIMDDGGKGTYGEMILHTRSFTLQEVNLLQEVLVTNFGLSSRLSEKTPGQWVIIIPSSFRSRLLDIVLPYMHVSMMYKFY